MRHVVWALTLALAGCNSEQAVERIVTTDDPQLRIVSLAPHLTELVYSAGAGDMLVGVIAFSDYPPAALTLPKVGDAFRVDEERLAALKPDLILAWEGGNPRALIDDLRSAGYRIEAFGVGTLERVATNLRRIGALTGRAATADAAANEYSTRLAQLRERYAGEQRLRVFFQTSAQPIYTINAEHAISEALTLCGGVNVFAGVETLSANVSVEAVIAANPEVMIAAGDTAALARWRSYAGLQAVDADNLFGVDPDLIARDSLRIVHGVERICTHLQTARERAAAVD